MSEALNNTAADGQQGKSEVAEAAIELLDVSKIYDMGAVFVTALDQISIKIQPGEFVVILGPSGSGKTTLLNLVGAIDTPTTGTLRVMDHELNDLNRAELAHIRRDHIGFIFQFFNLLPSLSARENVEYALQIQGKKHTKQRSLEVLAQVGLAERANHFPGELSGGEQQRVAIARALAKSPQIILADEPTGELDSETGIHILQQLHDLAGKGHSVIVVTHNSEIARIADRVIQLRSGKIVSDKMNPAPESPESLRW